MSQITNPYRDVPDTRRTTINFDRTHCSFIEGVHGRKGTLQATLAILLIKLINELKRNGITSYDPDGYSDAVNGATVILGRAVANTAAKAASRDDRRRTAKLASSPTRRPS